MDARPVTQWTEIFENLRRTCGATLTPEAIAVRILGDLIGYEHPNSGNAVTRQRRQINKDHDVAELANAIRALVRLTGGVDQS